MQSFIFDSYEAHLDKKEIIFRYIVALEEKEVRFTEKIILPQVPSSQIPPELLDSVLHSLHLMLGISYWKLYCPEKIFVNTKPLSKEQAQFWDTVYTKGLGEFFYKNQIDFRTLIAFPYREVAPKPLISFPRQKRSLVGIGGGKDSIVAAELLKKQNKPFIPIIVETQRAHEISYQISSQLSQELMIIKREIDPQLFELNMGSQSRNGHIPISAIFAWIDILTALLYDYAYVIVGNEKSAEYGNTEYLGQTINHQWSKTMEFEELFQTYVRTFITTDITYFSLLRPLSEYAITALFTQYPKYFNMFTSCNRNFTIHKERSSTLWCGECPKCAFTFIMLATYLPKERVTQIFGQNLLNKQALLPLYKELLGYEGIKPFECVGTPEEVKLAFYKVHEKGEYSDSVIMKFFVAYMMKSIPDIEQLENQIMMKGPDLIPEEFKVILN